MDRIGQLALSVSGVAMAPVAIGVAAAVLVLLGPALFLRDREPFDRLMEVLELLLGRPRPARQEPGVPPQTPSPGPRPHGCSRRK
jgi:hypothetical protein